MLVPDADDGTWAKIRFDADWTTMAELLPTIEQPATRVVVVNAFRDAVRNAEVDPGLALEALLATAAVDEEDVVVGSVLRFCSEVLAAGFTPVDRRPGGSPTCTTPPGRSPKAPGRARTASCSASGTPSPAVRTPSCSGAGWTLATCRPGCRSTPS